MTRLILCLGHKWKNQATGAVAIYNRPDFALHREVEGDHKILIISNREF